MRPTKLKFGSYRTGIVDLKGGINENVSSLELQAGELIDCKNYMIAEGGYGGYISTKGFEAFDGEWLPSQYRSVVLHILSTESIQEGDFIDGDTSGAVAVSLETTDPVDGILTVQCRIAIEGFIRGETLTNRFPATPIGTVDKVRILTGGTYEYHAAVDWVRNLVIPVPGEGPILGLHIYKNKTYAFRKTSGAATIGMYVADLSLGWKFLDNSMVYTGDHEFYFTNYNFYATDGTPGSGSTAGVYSMYWCDGQNKARVYDGTSVSVIDNTGMGAADKPIRIIAHNFHLWLVYPSGSLQHSKLGDPTVWDGEQGAGEIGLGDEITNLEVGVQSSLVITLNKGIGILTGNVIDSFVLEVFSNTSGARSRTTQRLLGTIFFIDDRGLSTLDAVQEYGDYGANSISQRFKQTLLKSGKTITTTLTSRDLNQYRIFFDDKTAIYVSFEGKEFKGATFMEFDRPVSVAAQGDKANVDLSVFASNEKEEHWGYVYRMDSGTSFDGNPIICRLATAYFHYGSPRNWKLFKRATIEITGEQEQVFNVKADYDYSESGAPRTIWYTTEIYSILGSSIYSVDEWGSLVYGASTAANRSPIYLQGAGTNISYKVISVEAYRPQHIIQNIITDYELVSRRV